MYAGDEFYGDEITSPVGDEFYDDEDDGRYDDDPNPYAGMWSED